MVTQWDPPHELAHTWSVSSPGEVKSAYPESNVTLTLEPRGSDVILTLAHLPVLERFEKQNAMGWRTYLDMTEAAVRGESPHPRSAYMKRNAERYGVDLGSLAR